MTKMNFDFMQSHPLSDLITVGTLLPVVWPITDYDVDCVLALVVGVSEGGVFLENEGEKKYLPWSEAHFAWGPKSSPDRLDTSAQHGSVTSIEATASHTNQT